jgi:hypothetical protein
MKRLGLVQEILALVGRRQMLRRGLMLQGIGPVLDSGLGPSEGVSKSFKAHFPLNSMSACRRVAFGYEVIQ